ncbi:hypothetical protein ACCO45_005556 [Purpureocillium lilacinum]|uniref:Uncharacterized protein n=1 Tax=Purpureocillium lilacinum TaxID=33203 RepID=A0ACC4DVT4_PURLI
MLSDQPSRTALHVAPLEIPASQPQDGANGLCHQEHQTNLYSQTPMTPPETPNGSQEDLTPEPLAPPVFHNFLRAFYPFHPGYALSDSSVTLPLDEGDVERTNCLNRESTIIQRSDSLRRCRKSLLSELSSLVKTAKKTQECQKGTLHPPQDVNDIIDEMILKAFKIVTKGVRFLDVLEDERRARAPAAVTVMATVAEESYIPPTPPAERLAFDDQSLNNGSETASRGTADSVVGSSATSEPSVASLNPWNRRMSSLGGSQGTAAQNRWSQGSLQQVNRLSTSMAHRVSLAGPSPLSRPQHLVSERLNRSHDKFLSHLGSFIGRLHLQSHSQPELALAIKQSATSGGELLAVIDGVCEYNSSSAAALAIVRDAMFERIQILVHSARDILANAATEGADIILPQDNGVLLMAATGCVKAAGECVAKAKAAIERAGTSSSSWKRTRSG